jgi:hypothetical protein
MRRARLVSLHLCNRLAGFAGIVGSISPASTSDRTARLSALETALCPSAVASSDFRRG